MTTADRDTPDYEQLHGQALLLRKDIIRMLGIAGSGHPGGSLSAIDYITYLYWFRLRIDPAHPDWADRDRFVLSKGHCAPAWYVALAARGYFPRAWLWTLRDIDSRLQGHPDMLKTPGVDMTSGSLGQGFSAATGIALGGKLQQQDFRVYVMLSDAELQEGIVWEAAMAASHYTLDNLIVFVDDNKLQTDGFTADIMSPNPIAEKWRAFGFETYEINGHDLAQIHDAVERCQAREGRPHAIVGDTIKGKGVPSLENQVDSHSLSKPLTEAEMAHLLAELEGG
ncbi:MAG: transketolase [Luteitalea sp.]|nr:transketolase [Luteitalea sp.]